MDIRGSTPPLAVTMGDPAGCGPAITIAAWKQRRKSALNPFFVIGPEALYASDIPTCRISTPAEASHCFADALPVYTGQSLSVTAKPGSPNSANAPAIISSIEEAVAFCQSGEASGLVTNPINKALLYDTGFKHPGHTEFLAALCTPSPQESKPLRPVMMLVGGGLHVALATIHIPFVDVPHALSTASLIEIAEITEAALKADFGLARPRLAFTGLNPHAGEDGQIGREEIDIINPAAEQLRASGISIANARSADTVFAEALAGQFDAIIAMTHDQGLIPVKTLDFWGGVNVTLGLPIVRTSPDHGTAYEAAAARTTRPDSLIAAIKLAGNMAHNRAHP